MGDESETVSSAAVKTEEIDPKKDVELLETKSTTKFRSSAATLHKRLRKTVRDLTWEEDDWLNVDVDLEPTGEKKSASC